MHSFGQWWAMLSDGEKLIFAVACAGLVVLALQVVRLGLGRSRKS
jgi:hypothetical protein